MNARRRRPTRSGCVAIVTGAAGGQGAAEARLLVERRARRCVVADVDDDAGDAARRRARRRARSTTTSTCARRTTGAPRSTPRVAAFGRVTALVNNAGISTAAAVDHQDARSTSTATSSTSTRSAPSPASTSSRPRSSRPGGGSIVNVSSVNGFVGAWGIAGYASSKFALRGLTRVASIELARKGVRVNSIHPGPIDTPMLRGGLPEGTDPRRGDGARRRRPGGSARSTRSRRWSRSCSPTSRRTATAREFVLDGGYLAGPLGSPNVEPTMKLSLLFPETRSLDAVRDARGAHRGAGLPRHVARIGVRLRPDHGARRSPAQATDDDPARRRGGADLAAASARDGPAGGDRERGVRRAGSASASARATSR